jgi:hypothetical protein
MIYAFLQALLNNLRINHNREISDSHGGEYEDDCFLVATNRDDGGSKQL